MDIHRLENPTESAAVRLGELLQKHADVPVLLLLSGGSSVNVLAHVPVPDSVAFITLTTADDRFSHDPRVNNFLQITDTIFYKAVKERGGSEVGTIPKADESVESFAVRQNDAIQAWLTEHSDGVVLALLGIGADGHIAGNFPGQSQSDSVVQHVLLPQGVNEYTERITTTLSFLKEYVTHAVVYAVGREKCTVISQLSVDKNSGALPASVLTEMPNVHLYTDCEV